MLKSFAQFDDMLIIMKFEEMVTEIPESNC